MDPVAAELVGEVRSALADAADPVKAPAMQAYMKSSTPFLGINAAPLRALCNRSFTAHRIGHEAAWREAVLALFDEAAYREERYAAIHLTGHRFYGEHQHPGTLELYRHLVVTGAWWDFVDTVAGNRVGPILRAFPREVGPTIRTWATDDDLWVRRAAVLSQLNSKEHTDTELLRLVLEANLTDSLHGREFFIRKAVGWALRQHARHDPDWVRRFVAENEPRVSGLTRREALKHLQPAGPVTP